MNFKSVLGSKKIKNLLNSLRIKLQNERKETATTTTPSKITQILRATYSLAFKNKHTYRTLDFTNSVYCISIKIDHTRENTRKKK